MRIYNYTYIQLYVYTTIRIYGYTSIRQYVLTDINLYAIPAVLYFSLRLYFILSLVSTTHFPYPNGAVILMTFIVRR